MRLAKFCAVGIFALAAMVKADTVFVNLDTSLLIGNGAGPFSLGFELADGSNTGDGNNGVVMSNFQFGAGNPEGLPTVSGTVSGDLSSSIEMTDLGTFSIFTQEFTPGNTLSFDLSYTNNLDPGNPPDEFIMAILDGSGQPLPTIGGTGIALLEIDFDSSNPTIQTFEGDPNQFLTPDIPSIGLPAPVVSAVPEPSTAALCGFSLVGALFFVRRKRWMKS